MDQKNSAEQPERHVYALMALASRSGAATTCLGALGLEREGDAFVETVVIVPELANEGDGGWTERLELARSAGGISPETIAFWIETANGVLWDIAEVPEGEYEAAQSMEAALDIVLEDVLVNPDPDPGLIDWMRSQS